MDALSEKRGNSVFVRDMREYTEILIVVLKSSFDTLSKGFYSSKFHRITFRAVDGAKAILCKRDVMVESSLSIHQLCRTKQILAKSLSAAKLDIFVASQQNDFKRQLFYR